MSNDLIERLISARDNAESQGRITEKELFSDAIAALSPVLPEDVQNTIELLKTVSYGKSHPVSTALIDAGDLIERMAREKEILLDGWVDRNEEVRQLKQRIEELEAALRKKDTDLLVENNQRIAAQQRIEELETETEAMLKNRGDQINRLLEDNAKLLAQIAEYDQLCERFSALIPGLEHDTEAMAAVAELKRIRGVK